MLEGEVEDYVESFVYQLDGEGHRLVAHHGHQKERTIRGPYEMEGLEGVELSPPCRLRQR